MRCLNEEFICTVTDKRCVIDEPDCSHAIRSLDQPGCSTDYAPNILVTLTCLSCNNYCFDKSKLKESSDGIDLHPWYCDNCIGTLLPFNHIKDPVIFTQCINEIKSTPLVKVNVESISPMKTLLKADGPKLDIFSDHQINRPLLNNIDLDPDENYYLNKPKDHGYNTVHQLIPKMANNVQQSTFMHINCRSILSKLSDLQLLLHQTQIEILAVTETWLDGSEPITPNIQGYNFISKPRALGRGGGVGIFINSDIHFHEISIPTSRQPHTSYEGLFIQIPQMKSAALTVGVIYRPPGQPLKLFNDEFKQLLSDLTETKKEIILLGDFNIDLLKHNDHVQTSHFMDIITSHHFLPTILQPTRITPTTATLIDNIFTNIWPRTVNSSIIIADISDHLPIIAWFDHQSLMCNQPSSTSIRVINDQSTETFRSLLAQCDFTLVSNLCQLNQPNEAYNIFIDLLKSAFIKAFPLIKCKKKDHRYSKCPWMTKGLLKSCNKKTKLYQKFIKNPSEANRIRFVSYRNKFKTV